VLITRNNTQIHRDCSGTQVRECFVHSMVVDW
jgi:hypothetical protein